MPYRDSDDEEPGAFQGGVAIRSPPAPYPRYHQEYPVRQPENPPTGFDAVRSKSFASFLRSASASPEIRVTAGGRVVPVGPNPLPPTFYMDFIDRIIQTAEEVEKDKTRQLASAPIAWLQDPARQGFTYENEPAGVHVHQEPIHSHDLSYSRFPCAACRTLLCVKCREVLESKHRLQKIHLAPDFKQVADMSDGTKIVRIGAQYFNAYLDGNGDTVVSHVKPSPEKKSVELVVKTETPPSPTHSAPLAQTAHWGTQLAHSPPAEEQFQTIVQSKFSGLPSIPSRKLHVRVLSSSSCEETRDYGAIGTRRGSKNPGAEPAERAEKPERAGDLTWASKSTAALPHISQQQHILGKKLSRTLPSFKDQYSRKLARKNIPVPDELQRTVPVWLKIAKMSDILKAEVEEVEGISENCSIEPCRRLYESIIDAVLLRSQRLRGIEMALAARAESMHPHERDAYIQEKGELIPLLDKMRKDKEKVREAVLRRFNVALPEPLTDSVNVMEIQNFMQTQNAANAYPAVPESQMQPGHWHPMMQQQQAMQPQPQPMMQPPPHAYHMPQQHPGQFYGPTLAPFQPSMAPNYHGVQAGMPQQLLRGQYSTPYLRQGPAYNQLSDQFQHGLNFESTPDEDEAETPKASKAVVLASSESAKREKKPVTIRRPDGTPVVFERPVDEQEADVEQSPDNRSTTSGSLTPTAPKNPAQQRPVAQQQPHDMQHIIEDAKARRKARRLQESLVRRESMRRTDDGGFVFTSEFPHLNILNRSYTPTQPTLAERVKKINWARLPGESKEDHEKRCKEQRELQLQFNAVSRDVMHVTGKKPNLDPPLSAPAGPVQAPYQDENQQYQPPPVPAPGYGAYGPVQPSPGAPLSVLASVASSMPYQPYADPRYAGQMQPVPAPGYPGARPSRHNPVYASAPNQMPMAQPQHGLHSYPSMPTMRPGQQAYPQNPRASGRQTPYGLRPHPSQHF